MKTFYVLLLLALIGIVFAKTTLNGRNERTSKYDDTGSSSESTKTTLSEIQGSRMLDSKLLENVIEFLQSLLQNLGINTDNIENILNILGIPK
ncbi:hypothetical protein ALC56_10221 [Trachymyrmex septentrionalis]|uniref:Uncharacterized protein n=1 Tax=Trachymyrmex septentrionalis TaxID=34720 RepID=A0A195F4R8_9HYME|nr:hypothetical protein ALC56_10221 [Trachymyrmex septentrionalis]